VSDAPGIINLVRNDKFTVEKWTVYGLLTKDNSKHRYYLCTIIDGNAVIGGHAVTAGQSFIVPSTEGIIRIKGTAQLIVSYKEN
jgi:mannose-6-phosphate isomerase class I